MVNFPTIFGNVSRIRTSPPTFFISEKSEMVGNNFSVISSRPLYLIYNYRLDKGAFIRVSFSVSQIWNGFVVFMHKRYKAVLFP